MAFTIDLTGKVVIVTGVSSGIGAAVAKMFARANAQVAGCALERADHEGIKTFYETAKKESGTEPFYLQCDLTDDSAIENFVASVYKKFGRIDILASNAGANFFRGVYDCSEEDWKKNMDLNFRSHWKLAKTCRKYLEEHGTGVIIITSSSHAYNTLPGSFPYNIAKAGLKAMVQSITIDWGPKIRCVGVAPGFIETRLATTWFDDFPDPEKERQRIVNAYPLKRLGTPDEIGGWFVFLSSEYAAFTGGQTYLIDGGRSALMMD